MAYTNRKRNYPNEYASKSSHRNIINDETVKKFLKECELPKKAKEINIDTTKTIKLYEPENNPIKNIIAIDAGQQEIIVQKEFPSSQISFFQFGTLNFKITDLQELAAKKFIDPRELSKLKQIKPLKLVIPSKNLTLRNQGTLTKSIRKAIYDFFLLKIEDQKLIDTLKWLLFNEYDHVDYGKYSINCPECKSPISKLTLQEMRYHNYTECTNCSGTIYLTDLFGLHLKIDDEIGAENIFAYLTSVIEQMLMTHIIKAILEEDSSKMSETLFIRDGPLAFFGHTSIITGPMRRLINFLYDNYDLNMVGLEKSGAFVDHANEIAQKMSPGTFILLDDDHIYKYIIPNRFPLNYGRGQHYSNKIIFKTKFGKMYVASLPTRKFTTQPKKADFQNLEVILTNIQQLKCEMYESALLPIALINKLVSLSDHPSSSILGKFVKTNILSK